MIEIRVDGEALDIAAGSKIRIRRRSQLFERDFILNDHSFPILLPRTPRNVRLLEHRDRIARSAANSDVACTIGLDGCPWRAAYIKFRGITDGMFDVDLSIPADPIITSLQELYLQDFDYGGPFDFEHTPSNDFSTIAAFYTDRIAEVDDTPFIFAPIRNANKFGGRTETYWNVDVSVAPNDDIAAPIDYVNYYDASITYKFWYYTNNAALAYWFQDFTPLPYLAAVFEHIFSTYGLSVSGDVMTDDEIRTMVIATNMYWMLLVVTLGGVIIDTENDGYENIDLGRALPYMTCLEFLIACMRRFNAVPVFQGGAVQFRSMNNVLDDFTTLDITDQVVPSDDHEVGKPVYFEIQAEDETLDTLREDVPDYDRARLLDLVVSVSDLGALSPSLGDFAVVRTTNKLYQYTETESGPEWKVFADYLYPYIEDSVERTVLNVGVALTSMFTGEDFDSSGREWLLPEVAMKMSDPFGDWHRLGRNDATKLRLLFYRGEQVDSRANTYPLLSTEIYDYNGDTMVRSTMAERIEGTDGIVDVWYARWIEVLRNAKTIKRQVRMSIAEFLAIDFTRKYTINGVQYFMRSADIEVAASGHSLVLAEFVTIQP